MTGLLQLSVAVAVPRAASIVGLFGFPHINKVVPVAVITGGSVSTVQVTFLAAVDVLPHASTAVQLLV